MVCACPVSVRRQRIALDGSDGHARARRVRSIVGKMPSAPSCGRLTQLWLDGVQVGYDVANNRWVKTNIARHASQQFGCVHCGIAFDGARQRLYSLCNYSEDFVMRMATANITTTPL